ncbi:hypothetical protein [Sinorhizobium sp. A49]|uniref:hypothetical protein n=1 Tax=Sinorhizobium sp. A49 TaxID=1945861 RepID=UPI0009845CA2|nr:hypothetical protein [Sinorhizobium sp. A49]
MLFFMELSPLMVGHDRLTLGLRRLIADRYIGVFDFFHAVRLQSLPLQEKTQANQGFPAIQKYFFQGR